MHFIFMTMLTMETLITDKNIAKALKNAALFLLGMFLASVPWIIYFAIHGTIDDWLRVYFIENIFGYTKTKHSIFYYTFRGLRKAVRSNRAMAAVLAVSGIGILAMPGKRMSWREKLFLILSAIFISLMIYGGGRNCTYYFEVYACVMPFGLLPLALFSRWKKRLADAVKTPLVKQMFSTVMSMVLLIGGAGYALNHSYNIRTAGTKYEDTVQGVFADYIKQYEDRTLLNFGSLDMGFYYAADVLSVNRYFCVLNNYPERVLEDQMQVLKNEGVHFVVTRKETLERKLEKAREFMPEHEFENVNYKLTLEMSSYYLYQRTDD